MGLFSFLSGNKSNKIQEFKERGAIIIDVRTVNEWNGGHIKGAKHIPLQEISAKISEIKKWNKPVITYCASGGRSGSAARTLEKQGIEAINGGGWKSLQQKLQR
ncbi:rhodanese-like domain-containing protein [Rasiella rasia]|uniref:Rhodanese-like domain-containing protein n=1 Tax=Rasiella rasia TaxID=2744027 RepID=A0A6G6GRB5_9FLAO|nr:rhodanese-like domain-containing protein [Rasiella rasia]QIE60251.1 rhodanese-like domain-containing protein [Rasiella rasia]